MCLIACKYFPVLHTLLNRLSKTILIASYDIRDCYIECCVFWIWSYNEVAPCQSATPSIYKYLCGSCPAPAPHAAGLCNRGRFVFGSLITSCLQLKGLCYTPALITSGPCCWNANQPPQISLQHWTGKLASWHPAREQSWDAKSNRKQSKTEDRVHWSEKEQQFPLDSHRNNKCGDNPCVCWSCKAAVAFTGNDWNHLFCAANKAIAYYNAMWQKWGLPEDHRQAILNQSDTETQENIFLL